MSQGISSKATAVDYDPFAATLVARVVPTTEAQREMWLADRLSREASLAYNESVTLHLEGVLNADALQAALRDLATRHEALRALLSDDGLSLFIAPEGELSATVVDFSAKGEVEQRAAVSLLQVAAVETPFDLVKGPLIRATLVKLGPDVHELIFTGHHIVCDGWSFGVLTTELMKLYASYVESRDAGLAAVSGFGDYALAQLDAEHTQAADAAMRYWISQFDASAPTLDLPVDRPRSALRTFSSRRIDVPVEKSLVDAVRKLGAKNGASLFATLYSLFAATIARLGGNGDLVVGVPAAGQNAEGLETLVGHCVNLLPIRMAVDFEQDVNSFLKGSRKRVLDAYDHQACTFGTLLSKLNLARDPSRMPLVSVLFNLDQSIDPATLSLGGLKAHVNSNPRHFENFELFLNASQIDGGLLLECQYNSDLFDKETVARWLSLFRAAIERAVADPANSVAAILAPTAEDVALLETFNRTDASYSRDARIDSLIARQVSLTPDAIALTCGETDMPYRELEARANALASVLRARGVRPGQLVGLFCGRNEYMIVGLYGILKSGAGYVPLDPTFPPDRLQFMAEDAGLKLVVSEESVRDAWKFAAAERVAVEEIPANGMALEIAGTADDVAYVIYTSGSTGKPKGVRVPHRSVANLLASIQREPGMTSEHSVLSVTTLSFDIAVSEVIAPLTVGARIVIANRGEATDGERLRALIESEVVDFIDATPSTWRLLLAAGWQGSPNIRAICTGEPLPPDLGKTLIPLVGELWNGYGPTETTVWSSFHRVTEINGAVPIGHPVANTQIHVVDARQRALPVGVVGELYIGGEGVTLGYLARPELTAEKFLPDPSRAAEGARWYRTGDLGRWRADGVLECLGRVDHQIKLRGYRIELGEIETNLLTHPEVARAIVITREDQPGDVRLVAYIVPKGAAPQADGLRDHLQRNLPDYMVPQHFITLQVIPLLPNGKLDRRSLPKPDIESMGGARTRVTPRTPLEGQVLAAMEQVLNLPGLGITDNFFALGGHSLLAARLTAILGQIAQVPVPLRAIFEAPTAEALSAWLGKAVKGTGGRSPIPRRAERDTAPTSLMQHRLWFLEQVDPGRAVYNTPSAHRLRGKFDIAAFEKAFAEIVRRQESLRTVFEELDGEPVQIILPEVEYSLQPVTDLSSVAADSRHAALMRDLDALAAIPFDLAEAPLFRVKLFKLAADEHVFYFGPHHIIWDGWSFDVFYEEMANLYTAYSGGVTPSLDALPFAYGDFAAWHRQSIRGDEMAAQLAHWKSRMAGLGEPLAIPTDKARPAEMTGMGATTWLHLPVERAEAIRALARAADATPFMIYLAAYAVTLVQFTGQRDIVIGVPVRGRQYPELEKLMGLFVNAMPVRIRIPPRTPFIRLVEIVRDAVVDAFKHPDVPFETLVRELHLPRDRSRFPLYQALFSYQDARGRPESWGSLAHDMIHVMQPGLAEDLSLWLMDRAEGVVGGLAYNTDILLETSALRVRDRFAHNVAALIADSAADIDFLALPSTETRDMANWNSTSRGLEGPQCVHDRIAWHARERVALKFGDVSLTYAELDARSNRIAHELRARGARRGRLVGLCADRGPDMLCALLAVLKSGAGYVPIDPSFPPDRIRYMIEDAGLAVIVTESKHLPLLGEQGADALLLDSNAALIAARPAEPLVHDDGAVRGEDCAYVIYTSGTTGKPKGVMVPHRAVVNFLVSMEREPGIGRDEKLVAVTTLSFDIAVLELFLPLTVGACVVLASREQAADARLLAALMNESGATMMQATPGTWRMLLDSQWTAPPNFKALIGGEALPADLATRLVTAVGELWNMYGPTETTVWSTCTRVRDLAGGISIGRPIDNTQVWVLDENFRVCPVGVPGEICIGGEGVTLGYLNRPELTSERFIPDTLGGQPGARLYRTGDRGRWRHDGQIEHLGRNDFQVKIRGYRIELGEIEAVLASHPAVGQAVAVAREDTPGDVRLVAYVVLRWPDVSAATLRDHASGFLPTYMIPQFIVPLTAIPLLPNGKVDRKALPAPSVATERAPMATRHPPTTESEKLVASVWSRLLGTNDIDALDNFFDIGGHSLLAMQAMLELETATGKRIDRSRFVFESLAQVAAAYDQAAPASNEKPTGLRRMLGGMFGRKKSM